ncbi:MAG: hypothetical protein H6898_08155 [Rhodobacter sp.]|nr:hypothetical protein [Paracoccaceae bacterium]MCC0076545.1 hypothetical protein [Rhodobacter sp.]
MPNVKIYVDHGVLAARATEIQAMLPALRTALCRELSVDISACQLAVIGVTGLPDQPLANVEYQYLLTPQRTRDRITAASTVFRQIVAAATGTHTAVRADALDPATYVALK